LALLQGSLKRNRTRNFFAGLFKVLDPDLDPDSSKEFVSPKIQNTDYMVENHISLFKIGIK
jgi:hypothetical protein